MFFKFNKINLSSNFFAIFIHFFLILVLFAYSVKAEDQKEDSEHRVIKIDVYKEISEAVTAETITDDQFIDEILSKENKYKVEDADTKIERANRLEEDRYEKAKVANAKKAKIKAEKLLIKKEKEKKIREDKKRIKDAKDLKNKIEKERLELKKEANRIKEEKKREYERIKKIREDNLKKENANKRIKMKNKEIEKIKPVRSKTRKTLNKKEWLETNNGKRDYVEYSSELYNKVLNQWVKPFHAKTGWSCSLEIYQNKIGIVKGINKVNCNPDNEELKQSVRRAIMQASPLPAPKDPRLFDETVIFRFSVE